MTSERISTQRQRELIEQVSRLVACRASDEAEAQQRHAVRQAETKENFEQQRDRIVAEFERQHAQRIEAYRAAREAVLFRYESTGCTIAQEEGTAAERYTAEHAEAIEEAQSVQQLRRQNVEKLYEEQKGLPVAELAKFQEQCDLGEKEVAAIEQEARQIVRRRCSWPADDAPPPLSPAGLTWPNYIERYSAAIATARGHVAELRRLPASRFLEDGWPVMIGLFFIVAAAYPCWLLLSDHGLPVVIGAAIIGPVVAAIGIWQAVRPFSRKQTLRIVPSLQLALAQARSELGVALQAAQANANEASRKLARRREKSLLKADVEWKQTRDQQAQLLQTRIREAETSVLDRRQMLVQTNEQQLQELETKYPTEIARLEKDFEQRLLALHESHRTQRQADNLRFTEETNTLTVRWKAGLADFQNEVSEMNEFCTAHFPAWNATDWSAWKPPSLTKAGSADSAMNGTATSGVSALPFGRYDFSLQTLADGILNAGGLNGTPTDYSLPAVLSYPDCPSLFIEAEGPGRDVAAQLLQNVMLRLLTSIPPGKVRFTIIDPVGLGQNFSAFMHLADFDERLVANRIWTESPHINQRLTDLTEHMENVIQKYLRNEFKSIQEYNEHAGEVAEAFQILVIANFPANFSDEAARRLVSIANSGARCGVFTLISADSKMKLPRNFDMADLEAQAATLTWDNEQQRLGWKSDDLRSLPLAVEVPPDEETFTTIVKAVGRLAKDASRVEVPFESVVPANEQWWAGDSRSEIEVPLGRAGAKKLQAMRLGKGTSQHVLIAGKTGSGKSTLINAMITNLALHYSPHELQFYLIDFKKGVEFKAYATFRLPHARVIAIESEREFGMSVLERLDQELKRRGDLFRQHGVQDVKGYRNAVPDAVLPRIMLVIDEFQEFFTTDDKISHDSSLLLDRLVRQGRAFGIHLFLGSQTLAGAYSLARSTISQMAVRIALQCSESDAHLILSEDNTAARLLSRPGEAIYNDANGLFEGNHPFQAVWLPDHQRETFLRRLSEKVEQQQLELPTPTVFEGNVAADPSDNDLLRELVKRPAAETISLTPCAWLGAAVSIKEPTSVLFRRQGGSNLLVVGQQEEMALGILANCLVALSAQQPSSAGAAAPNVFVLDGTRPESPEAGFWRRIRLAVSEEIQVVPLRDATAVVRQIAAEVERRLAASEQNAAPIYLVIHNLARFRDLKKSDDFGMSSFDDDDDKAPKADKQLTTILREGPALGVHTLIWADSYSNLNRWVERSTMRDLELRVLFQMSATDSSNLMDSPAASRLGAHMAILFSEELGQAEKFRPYGLPSESWLNWLGEQLSLRCR